MSADAYRSAVHVTAGVLDERGLSNDPAAVAADLDRAGLLDGGDAAFPNPLQAAVNVLGCRMGWADALAVVAALDSGGLLVDGRCPMNPDTHIVPVNELRTALSRIGAEFFVGAPDVDTAILDLPRREGAAVMYAVNRGLATREEPLTLTEQGRRVLDIIGGPEQ